MRPLINSREAAAILCISRRKLWELTASNQIPVVRIGRSVRFDIEDIERWVESNKTNGN